MKLEETQSFLPLSCPQCGGTPEQFTYDDGETLDLDDEVGEGRLGAALMWGNCPDCGAKLYSLEISVIPAAIEGAIPFNDGFFQWQERSSYTAHEQGDTWKIAHYNGVSNLSFWTKNGNTSLDVAWLDVHSIEPWLSDDPFETGREIVSDLEDTILALAWKNEAGQ